MDHIVGRNVSVQKFAGALKDNIQQDMKLVVDEMNALHDKLALRIDTLYHTKDISLTARISLQEMAQPLVTDESHWYEEKNPLTRSLMQVYGTEIFRKRVSDTYWVDLARKSILEDPADVVLVTDARFLNEITTFDGGFCVDKLTPHTVWKIRIDRPEATASGDAHASETSLDEYADFDKVINNSGTLDEFRNQVITFINENDIWINPN